MGTRTRSSGTRSRGRGPVRSRSSSVAGRLGERSQDRDRPGARGTVGIRWLLTAWGRQAERSLQPLLAVVGRIDERRGELCRVLERQYVEVRLGHSAATGYRSPRGRALPGMMEESSGRMRRLPTVSSAARRDRIRARQPLLAQAGGRDVGRDGLRRACDVVSLLLLGPFVERRVNDPSA